MQEKVRAHTVISGRVQGVFFRMETKQAAERFGVSGWVKNRREGTVEAVFEGDRDCGRRAEMVPAGAAAFTRQRCGSAVGNIYRRI